MGRIPLLRLSHHVWSDRIDTVPALRLLRDLHARFLLQNSTVRRRIARFTRSLRASLGLTAKIGHGPAALPFRREMPIGWGTKSRLDALDVDIERIIRGWDQHVPQLLGAVADVRADVFEASELQARVQRLEDAVAKLEAQARTSVDTQVKTAAEVQSTLKRQN